MLPHDPAHDRLMDRVAAAERPAHLDPYDIAALGGRHHDRRVPGDRPRTAAGPRRGRAGRHPARRVHARDIRDQMRQRLRHPVRVDQGLYRGCMHRELRPPRPDQLDRALHARRDHGVHRHLGTAEPLGPGVQPLIAQDVVHQGRHPGVAGCQMVQDLVRLRPQLARRIGRQRAQLAVQLLQRPAQRLLQHGQQLRVPRRQRVVGPPVGERHHRADELVAVPDRRRRQIDGHRTPVLRPQHLPPHPVLAPGLEGVGQRRVLPRQRRTVRPRVVKERVQFLPAQLTGPVAQDLRRGRVDENDLALGVDPHHALGRGPQNHLRLPLLTRQLGLGVQRPRQIAHDQHQQLIARVAVAVVGVGGLEGGLVRGPSVLQVRAGHLHQHLGPVRTPRHHPRRLRPPALFIVVRAPHRPRDPLGVEGRQQIQQPAAHQGGPRCLERLQRDGVGVDDRAVAVDEQQRVGKGIEYGCEASSASGWPAAHETLPPCYRTLPARRGGPLGWSLRALAREAKAHDEEVIPPPGATRRTPDMYPSS